MQNGTTDTSSQSPQEQAADSAPMSPASSYDASNGMRSSRFDQDRKLMKVREIQNQANAAEPQHLKTIEDPKHLNEGESFRDSWRKKPRAWKSKFVAGVAAAALAVCVPLAALATVTGEEAEPANEEAVEQVEATEIAASEEEATPNEENAAEGEASNGQVAEQAESLEGTGEDESVEVALPSNPVIHSAADEGDAERSITSIDYRVHMMQLSNDEEFQNAAGASYSKATDGSEMGYPAKTSKSEQVYTITLDDSNYSTASFTIPSTSEMDEIFSILGYYVSGYCAYGTNERYKEGLDRITLSAESVIKLSLDEEDWKYYMEALNEGAEDYDPSTDGTIIVKYNSVEELAEEEGLQLDIYIYCYYTPNSYAVHFRQGSETGDANVAKSDELHWTNVNSSNDGVVGSTFGWTETVSANETLYKTAVKWKTQKNGGIEYKIGSDAKYYELTPGVNASEVNLWPYLGVTYATSSNGTGASFEDEAVVLGAPAAAKFTTPKTCPFTPNSGYRFVGWSTNENATKADVEAGGTGGESATACLPGGTLYISEANARIYAIYAEATQEIALNYNGETPATSGPAAPASVWANENMADDGVTVESWSTTLPRTEDGILNADGSRILIGWTKAPANYESDLEYYFGLCDGDSAIIKDSDVRYTTPEGAEKALPTLYAVWDDVVTINYELATDANSAGKGTVTVDGSTSVLTEKVARVSGGQPLVKGASAIANTGSRSVFRYWRATDQAADETLYYGSTFAPQLDNIADGTKEITYQAYLRPAELYIMLALNGGMASGTTSDFSIAATPVEGADTYKATFPVATKDGSSFGGWVDNQTTPITHSEGEATFDTDSVPTRAEADWINSNQPVTVTYVNNNGQANTTASSTSGPLTVSSLPTPVRDGYTFLGWSETQYANTTDAEGDGLVRDKSATFTLGGQAKTFNRDTTLYALWDKQVEVRFRAAYGAGNVGQGTVAAVGTTALTGNTGLLSAKIGRVYGDYGTVSARAAANGGSAFLGWTIDSAVAADADVPADDAARVAQKTPTLAELLAANPSTNVITYYANYGISVTLVPEGGTLYDNGDSTTGTLVKYYHTPTNAALPCRGTSNGQVNKASSSTAMSLVGWNKDTGINDAAGLTKIKTGETTLTSPGTLSPTPTTNVEYHAVWDTPVTITFDLGSNPSAKFENTVARTITLTGNQMTSATLQRTVGSTVDQSNSGLKAMGWDDAEAGKTYTFDYWALSGAKATLSNPATIAYDATTGWGATRTYTAVYKEATTVYEVNLHYNGGKDSSGYAAAMDGPTKVSAGDSVVLDSAMTKDGYYFLGWTTDASLVGGGTEYNATLLPNNTLANVHANTDVYAVYDTATTINFTAAPAGASWGSVTLAAASGQEGFVTIDNTNHVAKLAMHRAGAGAVMATPVAADPKANDEDGTAGYLFSEWSGDLDSSDVVDPSTGALSVNATGDSPYAAYTNNARTYTANFGYRNVLDFNGGHDEGSETFKVLDMQTGTSAQRVAFNSVDLAKLTHSTSPDDKVAVGWGTSASTLPTNKIPDPTLVTTASPTKFYTVWDDTATLTYQIALADQEKGTLKAPSGAVKMVEDTADYKYHEKVAAHSTGNDAPKGIVVEAATDEGWQFDKFVDENGNEVSASEATVEVKTTTLGGTTINTGATLVPVKEGSTDQAYQTHTYTAKFKEVLYQIEYVHDSSNTATFTTGVADKTTFGGVKLGESIPAFEDPSTGSAIPGHEAGNKFLGWSVDGTNVLSLTTVNADVIRQMSNGKLTLKPVWQPYVYAVEFMNTALSPATHLGLGWNDDVLDYQAGRAWTGNNGPLKNPTACDENGAALPSDEAALYEFVGWYRTDDLAESGKLAGKDQALLMSAIATADGTADETKGTESAARIYAKFAPKDVTITFEGNGGTWTDAGDSNTEKSQYTVDKPYKSTFNLTQGVADMFKLPGHHVVGWNKNETQADGGVVTYGTTDPYTVDKADNTLYAVWSPNEYVITFDGNGKTSGDMSQQTLTYKENDDPSTDELFECAFEKEGFTFAGWRIQGENNGTLYQDKAQVRNLTTGYAVTLVAQWDRQVTITYDLNNPGWTDESIGSPYATANVEAGKSDSTFVPVGVDADKVKRPGFEIDLDANGKAQWNAESDGSGTTYAEGETYNAGNITSDTRLYLVWKRSNSPFQIVPYLQTINPANGAGTGYAPTTMTYADALSGGYIMEALTNSTVKFGDIKNDAEFPSALPPEGYQVSATNMPDTASKKITPATLDSDGNVTDCTKFNVYYDRKSYNVTYSYTNGPDGLSAPSADTYVWGQTVALADLPGKPLGKTYPSTGWVVKTASGADVAVTDNTFEMPKEDVVITLEWSAVQVRVKLMSDPNDTAGWPSKWEGSIFSKDYGTSLSDADMGAVDKSGITQAPQPYGITGWLQYKMTEQGGKGAQVGNSQVDPRSVSLSEDTVFVAQTAPCYIVTYTAGAKGTFNNIVFSGADVNGNATFTNYDGNGTNAKIVSGDSRLTHQDGYEFNGWTFKPAKDSASNSLTAGQTYTVQADGTGMPTYIDQDYEFQAVWNATDSNLRLKLTSTINNQTVNWTAESTVPADYAKNGTYLGKTALTDSDVKLPSKDQVTAEDYVLTDWKNLTTLIDSAEGSNIKMPGSTAAGYTEFEPVATEKEIEFTYEADDATNGEVTTTTDKVKKLTGTAATSSAKPKEVGYKFAGWKVKDGSNWVDLPSDGSYLLSDCASNGVTIANGSITPQKTTVSGVDKYTAASYQATFSLREMPIEVKGAEKATVSGTFSDTGNAQHVVDYGTAVDSYLTGKSLATLKSTFTATPAAGYQLATQPWKVSVYELTGVDENDEPVYAADPTVTLTTDPGTVEVVGKVVVEPNVVPSTATVVFDKNDGDAGSAGLVGTTDSAFAALTQDEAASHGFRKAGHHLDFWAKGNASSADKDTKAYDLGQQGNVYPAGATTVYAHWVPNTVWYVPNMNGGSATSVPDKFSGTYGGSNLDAPTAPAGITPPSADKEFGGWSKNSDGSGPVYAADATGTIAVDDDVADGAEVPLYAVWNDATYTLSYNANGGENANAMADKTSTTTWASGNTSFTVAANEYNRTNFDFVGWNTKPDGSGTGYQPGDPIQLSIDQKNTVLYAQWKSSLQTYNVYFCDEDGNRVSDGSSDLRPMVTVLGTDTVAIPGGSAPQAGVTKKDGLVFVGWAATDELNDAGTAPAKGNWVDGTTTVATAVGYTQDPDAVEVDLKQIWRIAWDDGYTIHYNSNAPLKQVLGGGSAEAETVVVTPANAGDPYDQTVTSLDTGSTTLDPSKFSIEGYTQTGWAEAANADKKYDDGETLSNPNHLVPMNGKQTEANLWATWQAKDGYTVNFIVNGVTVDTADAVWDQPFTQSADLSNVIPTGKALKGWYTTPVAADGAKLNLGQDTFGALVNAAGFSDAPANTEANAYANLVDLKVQLTVDTNPGADKGHPAVVDGKQPADDGTVLVDGLQPWADGLKLPTAVRPGYDLIGWTTEDDALVNEGDDFADVLGTSPESSDDGTVQLTLKPVWAEKTADITYNVNDEAMGEVSLQAPISWKSEESEAVPAATGAPIGAATQPKAGYHFVNWTVNYTGTIKAEQALQAASVMFAQADGSVGGTQVYSTETSILPGKDSDGVYPQGVVYTANYAENGKGRTTFDSNGGTGTVDPIDQTIGKDITLPSGDGLERDHYTFGGWELPDGTIAQPGDTYTVKGDDTVKAVWKAVSYKVTVPEFDDPKYGTVDGHEDSLPYGSNVPDDFTTAKPADGKKLAGWHVVVTDENGKVVRDEIIEGSLSDIVVDGDMTITAVWGDVPAPAKSEAVDGKTATKPDAVRPSSGLPTTGDPLVDVLLLVGSVAAIASCTLFAAIAKRKRGRHENR